jgi:hypothetical protein
MTSIRNFAYAALLAVTMCSVAPSNAFAWEPAHGKFNLTHDVRWGNTAVPAGEYSFSFDTNGVSPVLNLTKLNGAPAGFMVLVPVQEESRLKGASHLVLESSPEGSYVSAMQLPEFGMTLYFNAPTHVAEKQVAKSGTTLMASGK